MYLLCIYVAHVFAHKQIHYVQAGIVKIAWLCTSKGNIYTCAQCYDLCTVTVQVIYN